MTSNLTPPLQGIRVLDLTVALAGPYGALLLGGLGAEVLHIESPGGSDIARTNPPFVGKNGLNLGAMAEGEISLTILNRGRNKKSVTLDLKSPKGKELFFRLVKESDVILENMSEGTVKRLGVDYESVRQANPRIVYGSVSAFGDPSLYPGLKGMDIMVQALSGIMSVTGFADGPPTRFGLPIADLVTPMFAVQGILAALIQRGRTGQGQHVKVSMLDCFVSLLAEEHFDIFALSGKPLRTGNSADRLVPFGVYPTKDGFVSIVAFRPEWMKGLTDAMGQPGLADDPRFSTRGARGQHADDFNALIEAWTRSLTNAEVIRELFEKRQVPVVPVREPHEVLHDQRHHDSGSLMNLSHPLMGDVKAVGMGMPIKFSGAHAQFDQPAHEVGQANDEIYGGVLKMSAQEIADLKAQGII